MQTVRDLLEESLQLSGILGIGETVSGRDVKALMACLNSLIDKWTLQPLLIKGEIRIVLPVNISKLSYRVGESSIVSGAETTDYPIGKLGNIKAISILDKNEVEILITRRTALQWRERRFKKSTGSLPFEVYVNEGHEVDELEFFPSPGIQYSIVIYHTGVITRFNSPDDIIKLDTGYFAALKYGLSKELSILHGLQVSQYIVIEYDLILRNLKTRNRPELTMKNDLAHNMNRFDFFSGGR